MMKLLKLVCTLGFAVILGSVSLAATASDMPRVVARVGEVEITTIDLQAQFERFTPQEKNQLLAQPEQLNRMIGTLIYWRAVARDAEAAQVETKDALVAAQLRLARERVLGELYLLKEDQRLISSDQVDRLARAEFAAHPERYSEQEEVSARHILLLDGKRSADEDRALLDAIRAELEKGASFDDLAQKHSDDFGSAQKGGDLGRFGRGRMVAPFEEVAFALEPGQVSEPVKTHFGWHLIKVIDKHPARRKDYEEVREEIALQIRAKLMGEHRQERGMVLQNDPSFKINEEVLEGFRKSVR